MIHLGWNADRTPDILPADPVFADARRLRVGV
jgi:hypothetical protein